jgi:hypothetical protein
MTMPHAIETYACRGRGPQMTPTKADSFLSSTWGHIPAFPFFSHQGKKLVQFRRFCMACALEGQPATSITTSVWKFVTVVLYNPFSGRY